MLQSQQIWSLNKDRRIVQDEIIFDAPESLSDIQKSAEVLHQIKMCYSSSCLDVSRASSDVLGTYLMFENMYLDGYPLLSVFRSGFIGHKTGPNPELYNLDAEEALNSIFVYPEVVKRFWYFNSTKTFTFESKYFVEFLDFLYLNSILQNAELSKNIGYLLQQYRFFTDTAYVRGSTVLTPAKSVCFLQYLYSSQYANQIEEIANDSKLFTQIHKRCSPC